jgi:hypothetical protein
MDGLSAMLKATAPPVPAASAAARDALIKSVFCPSRPTWADPELADTLQSSTEPVAVVIPSPAATSLTKETPAHELQRGDLVLVRRHEVILGDILLLSGINCKVSTGSASEVVVHGACDEAHWEEAVAAYELSAVYADKANFIVKAGCVIEEVEPGTIGVLLAAYPDSIEGQKAASSPPPPPAPRGGDASPALQKDLNALFSTSGLALKDVVKKFTDVCGTVDETKVSGGTEGKHRKACKIE